MIVFKIKRNNVDFSKLYKMTLKYVSMFYFKLKSKTKQEKILKMKMNISFNLRTNQKDFMSYNNNNRCDKCYQQNEIFY